MLEVVKRIFSKASTAFSYPLEEKVAPLGKQFANHFSSERCYRIGPFYCDTSPNTHTGLFAHAIDFLVPDGSKVLATAPGQVIEIIEHNTEYGEGPAFSDKLNYVTIEHENQLYSQYAHLKAGSVSMQGLRVGSHVVRGQVIGLVGKTGWVEGGEYGDHLHFMIFKDSPDGASSVPITFND